MNFKFEYYNIKDISIFRSSDQSTKFSPFTITPTNKDSHEILGFNEQIYKNSIKKYFNHPKCKRFQQTHSNGDINEKQKFIGEYIFSLLLNKR